MTFPRPHRKTYDMVRSITPLDEALLGHGRLSEVARNLGISVGYLCDIRKGRKVPSDELKAAIAREIGVAVADLWPAGKAA